MVIYLDHAAATPLSPAVLKVMQPYLTDRYFNASATYLAARDVAKDLAVARASVAKVLGVRPAEIIFTAGGTEANNLAIQGVMEAHPDGNVVVSAIEHESVLEPAHKYQCQEAKVNPEGIVDVDDLSRRINHSTVLVSVMYANNEIGSIQPLAAISRLIRETLVRRKQIGNNLPLYLHTDACQAGNYLHLLVDKLGVDMMTLNAGKLYGPKQTGALYVKAGIQLSPQILGGGQEYGMRSGTENVANIIGFASALAEAQNLRSSEAKRLSGLRDSFITFLNKKIPQVGITANPKHILPNNIHLTIPGHDNERLMMALDEQGIMCAVGSACSASSDDPSHVLKAIGLSDEEARASLRFTMGRSTTKQDVSQTVDALAKLIV
jgi:cysteine desulfurase